MGTKHLRVRAVAGMSVSVIKDGHAHHGRYVGRDKKGEILPGGEIVHDCAHYRRALGRGELVLIEEVYQ